jgi:hypothetical protein
VVGALTMSHAQRFCSVPSLTDLFFPDAEIAANKFGAKRHRGPTCAQLSIHSLVEHPSPRMLTAAICM